MKDYCCDALKQAIAEGYLYEPLQQVEETTTEGRKFVNFHVLTPAIEGKPIPPYYKKHTPALILIYCPFCGKPFKDIP